MTTAPTGIDPPVSAQTPGEELANVLTHGLGLVLALVGTAAGVVVAASTGSGMAVVTAAVFGGAMTLVYLASTGFHLAARHPSRRHWRLLDHASIYALIAGTYTPVMLVAVGGAWGWSVFGVVWGLAAVGIVMKILLVGRYDRFERIDTILYLAMGWLCLVAVVPIWSSLSGAGFAWMVAGGIFYSVGCPFFLWERLRYNHAIWHGFVLLGTACHYVLIVVHVLPGA